MSRAGDGSSRRRRFFDWCAGRDRRPRATGSPRSIARPAAGEADRRRRACCRPASRSTATRATTTWWDFQLDGYGTWLWALARARSPPRPTVAARARRPSRRRVRLPRARSGTGPATTGGRSTPSSVHSSTLGADRTPACGAAAGCSTATADGGIAAAAGAAERSSSVVRRPRRRADGHLVKWLGSDAVDASLLACVAPFGLVDADRPVAARDGTRPIERRARVDGGVHRYRADTFYGGGRWVAAGRPRSAGTRRAPGAPDDARRRLDWVAAQATADGLTCPSRSPRPPARPRPFVAEWSSAGARSPRRCCGRTPCT